ncbi:membrane protein [Arthrobacter phage Racecar]|nr:hypothetical protein PBI_RACECAR_64 [Arthrobacter phage Racecar]
MKHLGWGDWLFFGYLVVMSLLLWIATWLYLFVMPGGWPFGLVALGASLLLSVCSAGIIKLFVDKANWDAEYELEKEKLRKERERLYA